MAMHLDSTTIKLFIDRVMELVDVGEAGEDYLDMLNCVLSFPLATAVRLARTQEGFEAYGCFSNLYQSVEGLSLQCFKTPACKQMLLHPRFVGEEVCRKRKVKVDDPALTKYFACPDFCKRGCELAVSYYGTIRCYCGKFMNQELYVQREEFAVRNEGRCVAFVSDSSPYMLNRPRRLGQRYLGPIEGVPEENAVTVGLEQISCLLLSSVVSATALTDIFLIKKRNGLIRRDRPLFSHTKKNTGTSTPLTVEVVVRKSDKRILFAVAGKEFIDLLFTFLTLPLATVWHMIGFPYWVKGIWLAFQGYELPPYYSCHSLLPNFKTQVSPSLVCSRTRLESGSMLCTIRDRCQSGKRLKVGDIEHPVCLIDPKSPTKDSADSKGGYAKDETLFLVSDDLVVQHLDSPSAISLVEDLEVSLFNLQTQQISIGEKEALQLLEASFRTTSALNLALGALLQVPR